MRLAVSNINNCVGNEINILFTRLEIQRISDGNKRDYPDRSENYSIIILNAIKTNSTEANVVNPVAYALHDKMVSVYNLVAHRDAGKNPGGL